MRYCGSRLMNALVVLTPVKVKLRVILNSSDKSRDQLRNG